MHNSVLIFVAFGLGKKYYQAYLKYFKYSRVSYFSVVLPLEKMIMQLCVYKYVCPA